MEEEQNQQTFGELKNVAPQDPMKHQKK